MLEKNPGLAIVKVGGVGYLVLIPLSTFYALPEAPAPVSLQIHTRIQDDALQLYGFSTQDEKDLFLKLLNIPRIGAGMALKILSGISPTEFEEVLAISDSRRLAGIPGIGKKSADRILLELKGKVIITPRARPGVVGERPFQDALSALLNLGYPKNVAEKALDAARNQGATNLEDLLRQGLKVLAR
ncbi:MAG: Holliday junction branch migration protein RuvA [Deltaproteobacteria bacterium]|nr:Holliday junction branch migration protein RuvA [Deltaproteobacteria bacterium]